MPNNLPEHLSKNSTSENSNPDENNQNKFSKKLTDLLATLLATMVDGYYIYKGYHWNLQGTPHFYSLHTLFDKHSQTIFEAQDTLAERLRQLGEVASFDLQTFISQSALRKSNGQSGYSHLLSHKHDLDQILPILDQFHYIIIALMEELITIAQDENDFATADLTTKFLQDQQQMHWFIISSIKSGDIKF